tara:strand:- start:285 stop:545 length:261 start_codon:yes stop_codon:yes gene_type:complete
MYLIGCALLVTVGYFLIPGFKEEWPFLLAVIFFSLPILWIVTCLEELFFKGSQKSSVKEVLLGIGPAVLIIALLALFGPSLARIFI